MNSYVSPLQRSVQFQPNSKSSSLNQFDGSKSISSLIDNGNSKVDTVKRRLPFDESNNQECQTTHIQNPVYRIYPLVSPIRQPLGKISTSRIANTSNTKREYPDENLSYLTHLQSLITTPPKVTQFTGLSDQLKEIDSKSCGCGKQSNLVHKNNKYAQQLEIQRHAQSSCEYSRLSTDECCLHHGCSNMSEQSGEIADNLVNILTKENQQLKKKIIQKDLLIDNLQSDIQDKDSSYRLSMRDTQNVLVQINHYQEESLNLQHIITKNSEKMNKMKKEIDEITRAQKEIEERFKKEADEHREQLLYRKQCEDSLNHQYKESRSELERLQNKMNELFAEQEKEIKDLKERFANGGTLRRESSQEQSDKLENIFSQSMMADDNLGFGGSTSLVSSNNLSEQIKKMKMDADKFINTFVESQKYRNRGKAELQFFQELGRIFNKMKERLNILEDQVNNSVINYEQKTTQAQENMAETLSHIQYLKVCTATNLKSLEESHQRLEQEKQDLFSRLNELTLQNETQRNEIVYLIKGKTQAERDLGDRIKELAYLNETLVIRNKNIQGYQNDIKILRQQYLAQTLQYNTFKRENQESIIDYPFMKENYLEAKVQLSEHRKLLFQQKQKSEELQRKLENETRSLRLNYETIQNRNDFLEENITRITEENLVIDNKRLQLEFVYKQSVDDITLKQNEIKQLQRELEEQKLKINNMDKEMEKLKETLITIQQKQILLEERTEEMRQEKKQLEDENQWKEQDYQKLEKRYYSVSEELIVLRRERKELEQRMPLAEKEIQKMVQQIAESKEKIKSLQSEQERYIQTRSEVEELRERLSQEIDDFENKRDIERANLHASYAIQINELQQILHESQSLNEQLQIENHDLTETLQYMKNVECFFEGEDQKELRCSLQENQRAQTKIKVLTYQLDRLNTIINEQTKQVKEFEEFINTIVNSQKIIHEVNQEFSSIQADDDYNNSQSLKQNHAEADCEQDSLNNQNQFCNIHFSENDEQNEN